MLIKTVYYVRVIRGEGGLSPALRWQEPPVWWRPGVRRLRKRGRKR